MKLSIFQQQSMIVRKNDEAKAKLINSIENLVNSSNFTITRDSTSTIQSNNSHRDIVTSSAKLSVDIDRGSLLGMIEEYSNEYVKKSREVVRVMKLYAVVKTLYAGYATEQETFLKLNFNIHDKFEIDRIEIGSSSTDVFLKDFDQGLNSVFFKFVNSCNKEIDIFKEDHPLIINMYM